MTEFLTAHQALIDWAEKEPDRNFLNQPVDGIVRTFTWAESADASRRMANALLALGLTRGDKVAILAKNSAEWFLAGPDFRANLSDGRRGYSQPRGAT
jgi:long-chain acyl-CoA synthetase